jgi:hypothetical protein
MKYTENLAKLALDLFAKGSSFAETSDLLGCSRRVLYVWRDQSKAARAGREPWDDDTSSPFYIRDWHGHSAMFDSLLEMARSPGFKLPDDTEFEPPPLTEEKFAEQAKADDKPIDDMRAKLLADLAAYRLRHKTEPDSPVVIWGRGEAPDCVVGPQPEPISQRDKERRHPRAHWSVNADLRPPERPRPMPPQRAAAPIEGAGRGIQEPSAVMRADAVPQHRYQMAERRHQGPLALRDAKGRPLG